MTRAVIAALTAGLLATGAGGLPSSSAEPSAAHLQVLAGEDANRENWRWDECRFALHDGRPGYSPLEVRITLRCARRLWPGNLDLGYRIVGCESGFDATAQNSRSSAGGVWQALDGTWASWKQTWASLMDRLRLSAAKLNGRANAILGWRVFRNTTTPWNASRHCWAT